MHIIYLENIHIINLEFIYLPFVLVNELYLPKDVLATNIEKIISVKVYKF